MKGNRKFRLKITTSTCNSVYVSHLVYHQKCIHIAKEIYRNANMNAIIVTS